MKKILLGIIGLVVIIGLAAYFMKGTTTYAPSPTAENPPPPIVIPPQQPRKAKVNVLGLDENVSGSRVLVTLATLTDPGYIVVYRIDKDKKVSVAGHSDVLEPGEYTLGPGESPRIAVTLDSAVKATDVVVAVLHTDDGNGTFDISGGDFPVIQNNMYVTAVDVIDVPKAATDATLVAAVETYLKANEKEMANAMPRAKDILVVTVHSSNYKFSSTTMKAKVGQTVRLTLVNDDGLHDLVINEFKGAKTKQLKGAGSETIEFVVDKKGSFEYYCSVGQHRAMGMKGTLTVE